MPKSAKDFFLEHYDHEHEVTMKVLRAYPQDQLDLKPAEKSNSARQVAWIFVLERYLGTKVWNDEFAKGTTQVTGKPPAPPESWDDLLAMLEKAHQEFREVIAAASEEDLNGVVHFFTGPKTMGDITRIDWLWFLLHDQIHHRGQFSVYVRMAGGKLPSIYGPTADEPWV
ncbi:MAG TPA: DinB family protein [Thermoanaerobaculia bacterium]|nr:DinB family protein [Thermoanaerobaculia bacterium]